MQAQYKKIFYFGAIFSCLSLWIDAQAEVFAKAISQARILDIMNNGPLGICQYNDKNICYAEIQNLEEDLNINEIVKDFDCCTQIGTDFLLHSLQNPVSPHDKNNTIANRQDVIATLVKHPHVKQEIQSLLQQAEQEIVQVSKLIEKPMIEKTDLSKNTVELVERNEWTSTILQGVYDGFLGTFAVASITLSALCFYQVYQGKDYLDDYYRYNHRDNLIGSGIQSAFYGAIFSSFFLIRYVEGLQKCQLVHSLHRLISISQQIESLCQEHDLTMQFNISQFVGTAIGRQLVQDIQHERYLDPSGSYMVATPAVHALVAEIRNNRNCLAPIFATIAEMDAYHVFADKIVETTDTVNAFCCVQFLDHERPTIHAKKFWNLLVNAEITGKVVANDIFEDRNIILTGPNEGGKTTGIRAVLQNIVLAQTFGVAAAQEFALTPFNVIHSYLNINDDILHGKSRFASEIRRAQDILFRIKTLEPREKFFFALDELFTGTNAEDGESCAYNFIDNIGSYMNIQFIYATHFNKLKVIGSANSLCANYKVDAPIRTSTGRFIYPYTLSEGASESYIAMDRARDAGLFK